jgi:hypothetical protein
MPVRNTWTQDYDSFVRQMNGIMNESSGIRAVGGVSVGAEVAAASVLDHPELYQRAILFSPFFKISEAKMKHAAESGAWNRFVESLTDSFKSKKASLIDWISNPKGLLYGISNQVQTWGDGCEVTERNLGRNGYCHFTLNEISANQYFGRTLIAGLSRIEKLPAFQIIAVEQDTIASTPEIHRFRKGIERATRGSSWICFFDHEANHSLLSRFDSPHEKKFWLPTLLRQATRFVTDGIPADTRGTYADEAHSPACALDP